MGWLVEMKKEAEWLHEGGTVVGKMGSRLDPSPIAGLVDAHLSPGRRQQPASLLQPSPLSEFWRSNLTKIILNLYYEINFKIHLE